MRAWSAVVIASAVLVSFILSLSYAGSQIAPVPLKVGVVDIFKVADGYQKKKDREAELNKLRDEAAAKLSALQRRIDEMNADIEKLDKNSPEYPAKRKAFLEKQEELVMRSRLADREVTEKLEQALQATYSEILAKIEEYRAQHDFDFILRVDPRPLNTQERIVFQLDREIILAHAKSSDVTANVIAFLNQPSSK